VANTSLSSSFLFILLSSQRLNLLVSLVSPFLLHILPPAVGIPFQSTYKPCCSETGCPSSNTEFPTSTAHQSLFRRCFFPPTLLLEVGFTLTNPTISTFIGAPGTSLAPFPLSFWRRKAIFSDLRLFSRDGAWPASRLHLLLFLSSSIRTEGLRQDNLGPPLVQISATTLVYISFVFVMVAARHLLHSHVSAFLHPVLVVGPTTRQSIPLSAFWALHLSLSCSVWKPD